MAVTRASWKQGQVVLEEPGVWSEGCPLVVSVMPILAAMRPPDDQRLPFFAYGVFKPGQLAFFQIKDCVRQVSESCSVQGTLLVRDGMPIIDRDGRDSVRGVVVEFNAETAVKAYQRISELEPDKFYYWGTTKVGNEDVNVLFGKRPGKGSVHCDEVEWDGAKDPLFTSAMKVVEETLQSNREYQFGESLEPLFRLQMAYLLLWSAIERYLTLRYRLGGVDVMPKVKLLGQEKAFADALSTHVTTPRKVFSSADPEDRLDLNLKRPDKSVLYYYQIRSNIIHRGKAALDDFRHLRPSLDELLKIFRAVLVSAFRESQWEDASLLSQGVAL